MAFRAPHGPFHAPPDQLHSFGDLTNASVRVLARAMTEAMDRELARILQHVDLSTTTVFFIGDNGTYRPIYRGPGSQAKDTVYEGGVLVPLIVAGQAVAPAARGREVDAIVQSTDLYASVLELAGLAHGPPQSVSMMPYLQDPDTPPLRRFIYSEIFEPNGGPIDQARHDRAARDVRYKVIENGLAPPEFYDLQTDPGETTPLALQSLSAEELEAFVRLRQRTGYPQRCGAGLGVVLIVPILMTLRSRLRSRLQASRPRSLRTRG